MRRLTGNCTWFWLLCLLVYTILLVMIRSIQTCTLTTIYSSLVFFFLNILFPHAYPFHDS
ncbi:hypothetical protein BDQ17DRAFT_1356132 [Cyathus striatus]|nr:hypothetical protein BDQ17DRAFT_1356132 [Cyathus striatus]